MCGAEIVNIMIKKCPKKIRAFTNQNKCAINHCKFKNDSITRSGHFLTKYFYYLFATTISVLDSDLKKSESENKTLCAITTKVISSKIRLKFFIVR